jgi:segregation and condensation protein A
MIEYMRRRLTLEDKPVRLKQVLRTLQTHNALVCAFLAVLELVRLQAVQLRQDKVFGDILIRKHTGFDTAFANAPAVQDDWR